MWYYRGDLVVFECPDGGNNRRRREPIEVDPIGWTVWHRFQGGIRHCRYAASESRLMPS